MATNRDKLLKGIRWIAVGFPFIFLGPMFMYKFGIPAYHNGNYFWPILSIVLMGLAGFFCVKGLLTVLNGFFDKNK